MDGPVLFSRFGKRATDVLTAGFVADQELSFSTRTPFGLSLTSSATKRAGGVYAAVVSTHYRRDRVEVDATFDADSNSLLKITVPEVLPSTKVMATLNCTDCSSTNLEAQYFHKHGTFTSAVTMMSIPCIDVSATVGAHGVMFGAEAGFNSAINTLTKYSAGISVTGPDYNASIIFEKRGRTLRASYARIVDEGHRIILAGELVRKISRNDNFLTLGGSFLLNESTTFKTRLNSDGKLGALMTIELKPKTFLTISTDTDARTMGPYRPKVGLGLAFGKSELICSQHKKDL